MHLHSHARWAATALTAVLLLWLWPARAADVPSLYFNAQGESVRPVEASYRRNYRL